MVRLGAVAALALGTLGGTAGTAEAKSIRCDEAGNCKTYCTQSLPNGNYIEYEEGTTITVTTAAGETFTYKCQNGEWVQQSRIITLPPKLGAFGPLTIGPIKLADAQSIVIDGAYDLLSHNPFAVGGCDPNTVGCPT